jgi:hypothetical protein
MGNLTCSVAGCDTPRHRRDLCNRHNLAFRKYGDPLGKAPAGPSASERFWSMVDKTSMCWNWTGRLTPAGYAHIRYNGVQVMAHRVAYELCVGPIPEGKFIDHKCHNRSCVNPAHLRPVTVKQNNENHSGAYSTNQLGIRGVRKRPDSERWEARVNHNRVSYYLGVFPTVEEANAAVTSKRNELFTHNDLDRKTA